MHHLLFVYMGWFLHVLDAQVLVEAYACMFVAPLICEPVVLVPSLGSDAEGPCRGSLGLAYVLQMSVCMEREKSPQRARLQMLTFCFLLED